MYQITNFQPLISLFVEVDLFNTRGRPPLPLMACSAAFRSRRGGRLPSAIIAAAAAARRPRRGAVASHAGIARPDPPPVLRLGKATARRFRASQERPKTSLRGRTGCGGASRVTMASAPGGRLLGAKESIRLGGNSREACESVPPDAYPHRARQ